MTIYTVYFQSPKGVATEMVSPKKRTPSHSAFSMFENSRRIMGMVRMHDGYYVYSLP